MRLYGLFDAIQDPLSGERQDDVPNCVELRIRSDKINPNIEQFHVF